MFDYCVACIALSWNDNVSSAYRIASAGEREPGRKQRDFAPKNAIHFSKHFIFQKVKSDTDKNLGQARTDFVLVDELNVTIVKSYFDPTKFREYFN